MTIKELSNKLQETADNMECNISEERKKEILKVLYEHGDEITHAIIKGVQDEYQIH